MPLTLTPVTHGKLCHGSRWVVVDEDDLAGKVAYLALGKSRHVAAILAKIDKKRPATRADAAQGAIKLLTVPMDKDPYHRDGWIFQAISWIAAHRNETGAVVRAPHAILAHKGFDGMQLRLDEADEKIIAVVVFEDKATVNPRKTVIGDVWTGVKALERGERMPELIQETGAILEAHQLRFPDLDIDAAVETILWEEARHYRVAITVGDAHDDDDEREALFKGFDKVAPGSRRRRQAETMCIPDLRKWMSKFAARTIKKIEAWRDNV
ncbi:MAG: hypothetical protein IE930_09990 [Stenotrophomonas sp.]|uniref:hypothetical protein n=1 Tax=Stenotrophomonas TaxID=40323 RepID=UPI0019CBC593|nr:hypothetical protein [Stenotrophomonas sp.]MBD3740976.1 hypothetical protein [Stenotrophomonas sp.]